MCVCSPLLYLPIRGWQLATQNKAALWDKWAPWLAVNQDVNSRMCTDINRQGQTQTHMCKKIVKNGQLDADKGKLTPVLDAQRKESFLGCFLSHWVKLLLNLLCSHFATVRGFDIVWWPVLSVASWYLYVFSWSYKTFLLSFCFFCGLFSVILSLYNSFEFLFPLCYFL